MDVVSLQCIITENVLGVTDASGDLVLQTNPRKGGGVLTFDFVACRVVTVNTVVTIEFVKGSTVLGLRTFKLTTADYWYTTRGPARIPSDFAVRLTFSDGGNVKVCEATIYGYESRPE